MNSPIWFAIFAIFLAGLRSALANDSSINCPRRAPGEADSHEVASRHAKLIKAFGDDGTNAITVRKHHKRATQNADKETYDYKISLCGKAGTQITQTDIESKKVVNLGSYNGSRVLGGVDWLMYSFGGGDKYGSYCLKEHRRSLLFVTCEEGSHVTQMHVIEESRTSNADLSFSEPFCCYLFEYNHPAACSSVKMRPRKLSLGSVLCIILVSISAAYIIFGMLYKRFVSQAKGFDQIPNHNFWIHLGNLSADGCDLVCRRQHQPANSYKGMADTLNIDSSDDEKDDQLLPM